MGLCFRLAILGGVVGVAGAMPRAHAIQIVVDYRYDTSGFFSPADADGIVARSSIEAAADFFSEIIVDSLAAIPTADPNTPNQQNTPVWRQLIMHPGTGQQEYAVSSAANASQDGLTVYQGAANEFRDISVLANQFVIYAGATGLTTAGQGGTGVGYFGSTAFNANIDQRGKPAGEYSTWGGYTSFDDDGSTSWHLDHATSVASGKTDLYSVALHEIGHALGLSGNADEWKLWQQGAEFQGPAALAAWKAEDPNAPVGATGIPTVSASDRHWKDNVPNPAGSPSVRSYVLGTTTLQETAMDPKILSGTRKLFTNVDVLALRDIGWTIPDSVFEVQATNDGDYNDNGVVDVGDYIYWRDRLGNLVIPLSGADGSGNGRIDLADYNFWSVRFRTPPGSGTGSSTVTVGVPEPAGLILCLLGALGLLLAGRNSIVPTSGRYGRR